MFSHARKDRYITNSNRREKETRTCRIYMEEGVCEQVIYTLVVNGQHKREGFVICYTVATLK